MIRAQVERQNDKYALYIAVCDLDVDLEAMDRQRPTRVRVLIRDERDQGLALDARQHDRRGRLQVLLLMIVDDSLHCERILDREERELRAQLCARRPEVAEALNDLPRRVRAGRRIAESERKRRTCLRFNFS